MAAKWPERPRLIGTRVPRVRGTEVVTGTVRSAADLTLPGMLHAALVRCPHAHATIKAVDTAAAENVPGFKALYAIRDRGGELFFAGEDVLAIAADTAAHAAEAARAVQIGYVGLAHLVTEEEARKKDRETAGPPEEGRANHRAVLLVKSPAFDDQKKAATIEVTGRYDLPEMRLPGDEPDAAVAVWDEKKESLTVWLSPGGLAGAAAALSRHFDLPAEKVTCHAPPGDGTVAPVAAGHGVAIAAARLAHLTGKPVKLVAPPPSTAHGSAYGTVTVGGRKDGTLLTVDSNTYGTSSVLAIPPIYAWEHSVRHLPLCLNRPRPLPSPVAGCYLTECAVDDFAARAGVSPLEVRKKSLPEKGRGPLYARLLDQAAKAVDWATRWRAPGSGKGVVKRGIGLALHAWGGPPALAAQANVTIFPDGSVLVTGVRRERGTAQRTEAAVIVAEVLGLSPGQVSVVWSDAQAGTASPQQAEAILNAAAAARDHLFELVAPRLRAEKDVLEVAPGEVREKGAGGRSFPWRNVCARLGPDRARGSGASHGAGKADAAGAQAAEVTVDTETGVVRVLRVVAVQECGLIIDRLTLGSQVAGDVAVGVQQALYEEWSWDRATGRSYRVGARAPIGDLPRIDVHLAEQAGRGPLALGGPPTPATAAAVGNAILNAVGVRVPDLPFTPDRVLAALPKEGA